MKEKTYLEIIEGMNDEELFEYNKKKVRETIEKQERGELETMSAEEFSERMDELIKNHENSFSK